MNLWQWTLRIAGLLVAATTTLAALAQPANSASSAASAAAAITAQSASNPTLQIQALKQIEVKLLGLPEPSGGPGWMGSLVIGAILAALSSIATTLIGADKRHALETDLQRSRHSHELEVARLNREHAEDLKVRDQEFQEALKRIDIQHQSTTQRASLSREDQKIETERRRLKQQTDASDLEIEVAVAAYGT